MTIELAPAPHHRETLRQCWERLGAGAPSRTERFLDLVEPYVLSRPRSEGDIARFRDLPWTTAAQLLSVLSAEELADQQNSAPTLGSVLVAAVGHPREVEVHGYLVPPNREDERLTAEGIVVYDHPELDEFLLVSSDEPCTETGCECGAFWASVQASFGLADALERPHLIQPRTCLRTGREGWYLWWT
jgi:hypothetical protein